MGYFEWLLKYGTLGFAFSAGIFPLVFAFALRLLFDEKCRWGDVIGLLITSFLCLRWSLSGAYFIPLSIYILLKFRLLLSPMRIGKVLALIIVFLTLNMSWMVSFVDYSKVGNFVASSTLPGSTAKSFSISKNENIAQGVDALEKSLFEQGKEIQGFLRELLVKVNPVILLFFIPGVYAIKNKDWFRTYIYTLLWLVIIAGIGDEFKPQLELRRLIIPFSFLATIPAAAGVVYLLESLERFRNSEIVVNRIVAICGLIVIYGGLIISPITAASALSNRSDEKYSFASSVVENLSIAVRKYSGEGRTFFFGFILHELGATSYAAQDGGHISPLAKFAGKPFYASDYYHRVWSTVDPIPRSYRARGEEGIEEFLNLVNVSAVVTFKREWADYCLARPWYHEVFREGRFRLFKRERETGGYFLQGEGEVKTVKGGIEITPRTKEIVIKYRYFPRLKVQNKVSGVELFPVKVFDEDKGGGKVEEVNFIGVRTSDQTLKEGKEIRIGF